MTEHYRDDWLTVHLGDCREVMAAMEPESVHCVVTSPPYWGLRDYGTAAWQGGDADHDHSFQPDAGATSQRIGRSYQQGHPHRDCACGATRVDSQLGLEPTPELYVESMVAVFREVRRVLRSDGTVWLNLGDSYAQSANTEGTASFQGSPKRVGAMNGHTRAIPFGLKPKDLVGIPWRVAFALQADGWYLRSDIIWAKPNPMPESVTDRPTKAHEYVFLLSKSARYFYDADAVREPSLRAGDTPGGDNGRGVGEFGVMPHAPFNGPVPANRNLRSVWNIATQPYPGTHFATFPRALVEPCIKAGCPTLGTVLDPFAGSGTTGLVAQSLSRRAVLIDLSAEYLEQIMDRNAQKPLGLGA